MGDCPVAVVSACLLGRCCRYDGGHKLVPGLRRRLEAAGYHILAVCPEAEAGLPIPRPPMDLHLAPDGSVQCLDADGHDHSPLLLDWCEREVACLSQNPPALFVLKSKSPSCGLAQQPPGLFAAAVRQAFPSAHFTDDPALPELP